MWTQRISPKSVRAIVAEHNQLLMEEIMEPYLVCVYLSPTPKEVEDGAVARLVVEAKTVMAKDNNSAVGKALKMVPKEFEDMDSRLVVRVLRFS